MAANTELGFDIAHNSVRAAVPGNGFNNDVGLNEQDVCGRFSLIDDRPVAIASRPGMRLQVISGVIDISLDGIEISLRVPEDNLYVASGTETIYLNARAGVELQVDWPERGRHYSA